MRYAPPLQPRRAATLLIVRLPPRLDPFEAAVRRTDSLDQTTPLRVTHLGFPRSGALWIEPIEECANLGVRLLHRLGQLLWEATDRPCHRHVISALELLGRPLIHKAQTSRVELCCDAVAQLSRLPLFPSASPLPYNQTRARAFTSALAGCNAARTASCRTAHAPAVVASELRRAVCSPSPPAHVPLLAPQPLAHDPRPGHAPLPPRTRRHIAHQPRQEAARCSFDSSSSFHVRLSDAEIESMPLALSKDGAERC